MSARTLPPLASTNSRDAASPGAALDASPIGIAVGPVVAMCKAAVGICGDGWSCRTAAKIELTARITLRWRDRWSTLTIESSSLDDSAAIGRRQRAAILP